MEYGKPLVIRSKTSKIIDINMTYEESLIKHKETIAEMRDWLADCDMQDVDIDYFAGFLSTTCRFVW